MDWCRGNGNFTMPERDLTPKFIDSSRKEMRFTEIEQETNKKRCERIRIMDRRICEGLCTNQAEYKDKSKEDSQCVFICRSLMQDAGHHVDICPFEPLCPSGCPCRFFRCVNVDTSEYQVSWYNPNDEDNWWAWFDYYYGYYGYKDPVVYGDPGFYYMFSYSQVSEFSYFGSARAQSSFLALLNLKKEESVLFPEIGFEDDKIGFDCKTKLYSNFNTF